MLLNICEHNIVYKRVGYPFFEVYNEIRCIFKIKVKAAIYNLYKYR